MNSYYLDSGYLDMARMIHEKAPFIVVLNGRGTGKTFGSLKYAIESGETFIFLRRTQTQVDLLRSEELSPFKAVNRECGFHIIVKPINKYVSGAYDVSGDVEQLRGYVMALSTFSSLRGFDASDVKLAIFDEFIPEAHDRPIKNEGAAFLNFYESVNRNRELSGRDPLKVLLLSNTNTLYSPILESLGVLPIIEKMKRRKQEFSCYQNVVAVFMPIDSPISAAKKATVLYRIANNGDFVKMSLENTFSSGDMEYIRTRPLKEFNPLVAAGTVLIYRHKSNDEYYVLENKGDTYDYGQSKTEKVRFNKKYGWLYFKYINGKVSFQSFTAKLVFEWYFT